MRRKERCRSKSGISMVEFVASMVLGLPLVVTMLYAVLEVNLLFVIRTNLDAATRQAAQALINDYVKTGNAAPDTSNGNLPSAMAFDIKTSDGKYFVSKTANQFTWTWDLANRPATVTVTATFPTAGENANSLMPFPSPDPLHMANQFSILTSATFPVPPPG